MTKEQLEALLRSVEDLVLSVGGDGEGYIIDSKFKELAEFYRTMPDRRFGTPGKYNAVYHKENEVSFVNNQEHIVFAATREQAGELFDICVFGVHTDNGVLP